MSLSMSSEWVSISPLSVPYPCFEIRKTQTQTRSKRGNSVNMGLVRIGTTGMVLVVMSTLDESQCRLNGLGEMPLAFIIGYQMLLLRYSRPYPYPMLPLHLQPLYMHCYNPKANTHTHTLIRVGVLTSNLVMYWLKKVAIAIVVLPIPPIP